MKLQCLIAINGFLFCIFVIANSAVPKPPFLGIPPQELLQDIIDTINCKNGSKKFTKLQLNDDFCDCPDGSDEPGTSACPNGKFYCRNSGHIPLFLFSSRVNDGICDCCDGSHEYDGQNICPNTCWEAGKIARDKLQREIATYKEGVTLRKKEVEKAKLAIAKEEAELAKLRNEENILKGLVQQLKERKEQIDKAEEKERLQKEKEEKERREAEENSNMDKSKVEEDSKQEGHMEKSNKEDENVGSIHDDQIGVLDDSPSDQDDAGKYADQADTKQDDTSRNKESLTNEVEQNALQKEESASPESMDNSAVVSETVRSVSSAESHDEATKVDNGVSENTEGLSKEELGRLVASRWTESSEKKTQEVGFTKDDYPEVHDDHEENLPDSHDDDNDVYSSDFDEDCGTYEDVDEEDDIDNTYENDAHHDDSSSYKPDPEDEYEFSDTTSPSNPSWLEKIQKTVCSILHAVNIFQTPIDKSEAARVCKEYEESSTKLSKIQSRISSLAQKLGHEFGKEKEFYVFYDHCFDSKQNKYVYKVCPFKHASQEEGHSSTRLGRWDKFEDSHRTMTFSNGHNCWNGPDRSLKVKLRCGLQNEVTDVDEPSRCEYEAVLSTPALCFEQKLKDLEEKFNSMINEQPQSHDEL